MKLYIIKNKVLKKSIIVIKLYIIKIKYYKKVKYIMIYELLISILPTKISILQNFTIHYYINKLVYNK